MVIDGEDFYLDPLFSHRKLRRLIAVELKLGRFKAADKGQMELYLLFRYRNNKYFDELRITPNPCRPMPRNCDLPATRLISPFESVRISRLCAQVVQNSTCGLSTDRWS
jgi:hypothetical protein